MQATAEADIHHHAFVASLMCFCCCCMPRDRASLPTCCLPESSTSACNWTMRQLQQLSATQVCYINTHADINHALNMSLSMVMLPWHGNASQDCAAADNMCDGRERCSTGAWLLVYEDFTFHDKLNLVKQLVQHIAWCSTAKVRFWVAVCTRIACMTSARQCSGVGLTICGHHAMFYAAVDVADAGVIMTELGRHVNQSINPVMRVALLVAFAWSFKSIPQVGTSR